MTVTVFHNPACSTSRKTVELIRQQGIEPAIVEYLKAGWTRPQLQGLLKQMGVPARDILRAKNTRAEELGLTDPAAGEDQILDAMVADPVLVERPIVVGPGGAVLARPIDRALSVL